MLLPSAPTDDYTGGLPPALHSLSFSRTDLKQTRKIQPPTSRDYSYDKYLGIVALVSQIVSSVGN